MLKCAKIKNPTRLNASLIAVLILGAAAGCQAERADQTADPFILSHDLLYEAADEYTAWPAIARAANGDLVVAFTRTEEHVSPNGAIVMIRSTDQGMHWSAPTILYDSPIDDRESGLTTLPDGRLLVHLWSTHWTPEAYRTTYAEAYDPPLLERWASYVDRPAYRNAADRHGGWVAVSADNGHTWSAPVRGPDSIHGGIALQDGTLLVAAYRQHEGHVGVYTTASAEDPWEHVQTVYCPQPDSLRFGEPHVLQLPSGRILMLIRATAKPYNDQDPRLRLWETYSDDQGKTWAEPFETPLWGFPPHLTVLSDGRVLATYGHRRPPYGQRAALSLDGITWDLNDEIILRDDAPNKDLGYPVSIEVAPDTVLTVYYQENVPLGEQQDHPPRPERKKADIWGTRWVVPPHPVQR